MITAISDALESARRAAHMQSDRMQNELNSAIEAFNNDKMLFSTAMQGVAAKRAEAEKAQSEAMRAFDSALMQTAGILVALKNQIAAGEIVTGADTPLGHEKPRLIKNAPGKHA